jgi:3-phenylpropionate/trans-cinnamate dioxygenase ferredoxin reductase subunit
LLHRSIPALTATAVERRHRAEGTRILFETTVSSVNGKTRVESVTTSSGEVIEADAVLFAIGVDPVVGLARLAGVECDNGIVVDACCRTSVPNIYAIGDCANQLHLAYGRHLRLESVNSALFHARSAAADLLGHPLPAPKPPSFWSEQCGLTIQVLGVPHPGSPCEDVLRGDDTAFSVYRFQDGELVAVEAVNRPRDFVQAHAIVGQRNVTLPID